MMTNNTKGNKGNLIKNTSDLARYGTQLAMLNKLLSLKLMSEKEHCKVKIQLMKDYGIKATAPV